MKRFVNWLHGKLLGRLDTLSGRMEQGPTQRTGDTRVGFLRDAIDAGDMAAAADLQAVLAHSCGRDPEFAYLCARLAFDQQRLAECIQHVERALVLDAANPDALALLAAARFGLGDLDGALTAAERAEHFAPGNPQMLSLAGVILCHRGELERAQKLLDAAFALNPQDAMTVRNLAILHFRAERWQDALQNFRKLSELQPGSAYALVYSAKCLLRLGCEPEAWQAFDQALSVQDTEFSPLHDYLAALFNYGRLDAAREQALAALAAQPEDTLVQLQLANIALITEGSRPNHWHRYEARLDLPNLAPGFAREKLWRGPPERPRHLVVRAEQGLGDSFLFCRYLPDLRRACDALTFAVPPTLYELMRHSAIQFEWDATLCQLDDAGSITAIPAAREILLMSAVATLNTEVGPNRAPYLAPDPQRKAQWADRLGPRTRGRLRVGLVWAGNPNRAEDAERSIAPQHFSSFGTLDHVEFFSLQKDCLPKYTAQAMPFAMRDLAPAIADFADTAAAMCEMDLILSIDTAAAHLAGALGLPCWVLLSKIPDWRWQMGSIDQPWYGGHRSFRVARQFAWTELLADVAEELRALVGHQMSEPAQ
ncbi:MAG: hypothetical protein JNJ60_11610 [Rhodocyclaceae bacterium]|nr:hypothetical protein [Rhodocyclaceae bacterium]